MRSRRGGIAERRCEPALAGAVEDDLDSLSPHELGALRIRLQRAERSAGAGEDEAFDALGCVRSEPLADHAAEREPAEVSLRDPELVQQLDQCTPDVVDGDATVGHGRASVTGMVDPEHAMRRCEGRHLRVPHRRRRAQAAREHQHGRIVGTVEAVRQPHCVSR